MAEEALRAEIDDLRQVNQQLASYKLMADQEKARLAAELEALRLSQAERVSNAPGVPPPTAPLVKRELALQAMIKPWSGDAEGPSVEEFLQSVKLVALTGHWTDQDQKMICRLKTTGAAAACLAAHPELLRPEATFSEFETALRRRFEGSQDPERHLLALNTITQSPGESVLAFADRCRRTGLKTLRSTSDPNEAKWAREQMERTVLAAFVRGLKGTAGMQLQFYPPRNLDEATRQAERIEQAQLALKPGREVFVTQEYRVESASNIAKDQGPTQPKGNCFSCGATGHFARNCPNRAKTSRGRGDIFSNRGNQGSSARSASRVSRFCFVCGDPGHLSYGCPNRAKGPKNAVATVTQRPDEEDPNDAGSPPAPRVSH